MELNTSAAAPACKIEVTHGPWRRHMPSFDIPMVNHPTAKRLDALLSGHNWNRNRFIRKLRKEGATLKRRKLADGTWKTKYIAPRRASIRLEREQTLDALARAMIYRADYDPDAPYLFEVKASVEELARMIGQLHEYEAGYDGDNGQYRHGRKACDPVHGAVDDFEAADMIVVVREFDQESKTNKAKRIFFKPNFFKGFGLTMEDTRSMLSQARKWQEKSGFIKTAKQKRQAEVLRLAESDRVASLDRPSLRNLLARLKREFTGENKHTKRVMDAHHRLKDAEKRISEQRKQPQLSDTEMRLRQLQAQLPPVYVYQAKNEIKAEHGLTNGPEFDALLLAILETRT
ncbi:hypothetical protein G4168_17550 [Vibrio parahaemolyticus]|uniref:hypothetical protein n=1 Tax=Vibrio TaxID=662 RepID=UPI00177A8BCD|nr:hypothetical protein [Vibrio parahaemolyticus]MBD6984145.1 hypothetical protein [Vibrio parahaemolyticus]MBD6988081.1 hypothetical protein [Vibrio parahaemolyticus]MDF4652389.1 hypothetical protein [Vibrio parahaemolyticus]